MPPSSYPSSHLPRSTGASDQRRTIFTPLCVRITQLSTTPPGELPTPSRNRGKHGQFGILLSLSHPDDFGITPADSLVIQTERGVCSDSQRIEIMARTFSNPTVVRALDAAMFQAPVGLPSAQFKQELEHRLMDECHFTTGFVGARQLDRVRLGVWEVHGFRVLLKAKPGVS